MATSTSCIYKSVTLQEGEVFVLPPGAEVISVSDEGNITSDCLDTDNLEDLQCYAFVFGVADDDGGNEQLFEANNGSTALSSVPALGIVFNDIFYAFPSVIYPALDTGIFPSTIKDAINDTAAGTLIFNQVYDYSHVGDKGTYGYVVFRTIPSIAENLKLRFKTYSTPGWADQEIVFDVPVKEYAEVSGYTNIPACSVS